MINVFFMVSLILISPICLAIKTKEIFPLAQTSDEFGVKIGPGHTIYNLKSGSEIYHGTTETFTLDGRVMYFTPDSNVALAHVQFFSHNNHAGRPIILKVCNTKKLLKLVGFSYDSASNIGIYKTHGLTEGDYNNHFGKIAAGAAPLLRTICSKFISEQYDGWRSPWDEDEIALCNPTAESLDCRDLTCAGPGSILEAGNDYELQALPPGGTGAPIPAAQQYNHIFLNSAQKAGVTYGKDQINEQRDLFLSQICG
jgi:hypothetical protein